MDVMDAARERELIAFATRCHVAAGELEAGADPEHVRRLLHAHLKHSAALAVLLIVAPPAPPVPPPAPWWGRLARAVRAAIQAY